ncbi:MAG: leucyl aminopeptidase [Novosphingobium sp.]|jgi:leucyl aminopeptidase|uniref:leucyl aminopeptidase n=1 Tax=Novosphingobium sp. TaxID=1874826 RepID=UPI003919123F
MRLLLAATCLAAFAVPATPALAQTVIGSGVPASTAKNSAERPIAFASSAPTDAALVILLADKALPADAPLAADGRKAVAAALAASGFVAKANEVLSLRGIGTRPRIHLVGLGKEPGAKAVMEAAGKAAQDLRGEKAAIAVFGAGDGQRMADAALGYSLGQYRFDKYKSAATPPPVAPVTVLGSDAAGAKAAWEARHAGLAEGVRFTRDMATEPASAIYPESFVARTREAFAGLAGVSIEVLDEAAMRKLGMGSIVGVGQGSPRGSRLLLVTYKGAEGAPLAMAGKGITFDSGGVSIKPGANMWQMKADMSGAAAVVGAALSLARSKAPVHVVAVAALAENMPDGNAQRPGDVVRTMSGKTIEILNTDAEGRLVLADAVEYVAATRKPSAIVDIATLTGSASAALGDEYAALFSRGDAITAAVQKAGDASGEPVWRLPLHPNYADDMKSDIADIKNVVESGSPGAGFGAHFIGHFIDPAMPWAHIDMAGTMWASSSQPLTPKGSTGYGVRLLDELARTWKP